MSEHKPPYSEQICGVYQAFRWWGVGTKAEVAKTAGWSLSSVPVVGCRNKGKQSEPVRNESIKRSGGGVSERRSASRRPAPRVYQAFRWWGVGTPGEALMTSPTSLSSVPVVGCRNFGRPWYWGSSESIKRSGGGVSEPRPATFAATAGVYQAFRWWGVGTEDDTLPGQMLSLSSVPVVGCRNRPFVRLAL